MHNECNTSCRTLIIHSECNVSGRTLSMHNEGNVSCRTLNVHNEGNVSCRTLNVHNECNVSCRTLNVHNECNVSCRTLNVHNECNVSCSHWLNAGLSRRFLASLIYSRFKIISLSHPKNVHVVYCTCIKKHIQTPPITWQSQLKCIKSERGT